MKKLPVLVVDDSVCTANIVVSLLKLCGYSDVDKEGSAQSALWKFSQRPYSLVLADMAMPVTSGIELLAAIRRGVIRPNVCFVLMTALRDREVIDAAVRLGADSILLKPFTADTLQTKLSSLAKLQAA